MYRQSCCSIQLFHMFNSLNSNTAFVLEIITRNVRVHHCILFSMEWSVKGYFPVCQLPLVIICGGGVCDESRRNLNKEAKYKVVSKYITIG
jgi:hypothetical protein